MRGLFVDLVITFHRKEPSTYSFKQQNSTTMMTTSYNVMLSRACIADWIMFAIGMFIIIIIILIVIVIVIVLNK